MDILDIWQFFSEDITPLMVVALVVMSAYQFFVARGKRSDATASAITVQGAEIIELRGMFKATNDNFVTALKAQTKAELREADTRTELALVKDELTDVKADQERERKKLIVQAKLNTEHAETINRLEETAQSKDKAMQEFRNEIATLKEADKAKDALIEEVRGQLREETRQRLEAQAALQKVQAELATKTSLIDQLSSQVADMQEKITAQAKAHKKELGAERQKRQNAERRIAELEKKSTGDLAADEKVEEKPT